MSEAFATSSEFLARVSPEYVKDLVSDELTGGVDEARVTRALEDATAELLGYKPRVPASYWPGPDTLRTHCCKVALYMLSLDRPAKEWESIRNAYTDTIEFYKGLIADAHAAGGAPPVAGVGSAPAPVFTDRSLKGFT